MGRVKLLGAATVTLLALAASAIYADAASTKARLQLRTAGKPLAVGGEVLLAAGYSLDSCYWEEQEFRVTVNNAGTDRLVRTGPAGQLEECSGGAKTIELTSARKMIVKLAPMHVHLTGPCVYTFRELSANFAQREWGPETYGSATGKLNRGESARSCAKTSSTSFDVALVGLETRLVK